MRNDFVRDEETNKVAAPISMLLQRKEKHQKCQHIGFIDGVVVSCWWIFRFLLGGSWILSPEKAGDDYTWLLIFIGPCIL